MKIISLTVSLLLCTFSLFAQAQIDTSNNGMLTDGKTEGQYRIVVRQHRQLITIGNLADDRNRAVYEQPNGNGNPPIASLKNDETILAYQIEVIENTRDDTVSSWLNISTENNIKGWIYLGGFDPYSDSSWELIEEINNSTGHWTVRRLDQMIAAYDSQKMYSEPGRIEENVVFTISREGIQPQINLSVIAITEEEDTIDDQTDHWLKTVDGQGRIGWIFGGYTDVMRGGPKYEIPGAIIQFVLGYY